VQLAVRLGPKGLRVIFSLVKYKHQLGEKIGGGHLCQENHLVSLEPTYQMKLEKEESESDKVTPSVITIVA
jgi:hypothetical protein